MEELTIGERIKKRRVELGMTLKDLSEKSGILPQLISDYENNRKEPGMKNIKSLCKALEVRANYMLEDDYFVSTYKSKTYGAVLYNYLTALEISRKDELKIDKENMKVSIEINDPTIVKAIIQLFQLVGDFDNAVYEAMKNFNVNILSEIEIK